MTVFSCKVVSIESIKNAVYRVLLLPDGNFYFRAGQYLMIILNEQDKRPFSIVSIPSERTLLELHIGVSKFNNYTMSVIDRLIEKKSINIDLPYGQAWFREGSKKPIILIAGGTGFAYINSILHAALEENHARDIYLYWGGKRLENLYYLDELKDTALKYPNIEIIPVVEQPPEPNWRIGHIGTVLNAVLDDFLGCSLAKYEIYMAGRFEMAKRAKQYFCNERGVSEDNLYGDMFEFISHQI